MIKKGMSNRQGGFIIAGLIIVIVLWWALFVFEVNRPEPLGCFDAVGSITPEESSSCLYKNGSLKLGIKIWEIDTSNLRGLRIGDEKESVYNYSYIDKNDYDFPDTGETKVLVIEGDFSSIQDLGVAPVIVVGKSEIICDRAYSIKNISFCDG